MRELKRILACFLAGVMSITAFPAGTVCAEALTESSAEAAQGAETDGSTDAAAQDKTADESTAAEELYEEVIPQLDGLTFEKQMDFKFAQCVDIYYYEGGYRFFDVYESAQYLLVPEGGEVPANLAPEVKIIQGPVDCVYEAATAIMALINAAGALDKVRFSSITAENWYVDEAAEAMERGDILFAGKYSEPDYEMMIAEGCDLAIESTMILHTPKVQEMIEMLGIPVFIDRSSYEPHPLGRSEWVKVYGALFGVEDQAEAFFDDQAQVLDDIEDIENSGKTVAFFSMHSNGTVSVRRTDDYVPRMIELAGGKYALGDMEALKEAERTSVSITVEQFYAGAVDADYIVYNGTIENPIRSIDELVGMNPVFADFKAVKEGNVWCTDKYLYQATDIVGQLIRDFYHMLTDGDENQMVFLTRIS